MWPEHPWITGEKFDTSKNDGVFFEGEDMLQYPPNEMILVCYGDDKHKEEMDTLLPDEQHFYFQFTVEKEEEADALIESWKRHREKYRHVWNRGKEQQEILKGFFDLNARSWSEYQEKKAVQDEKVSWSKIVRHPEKYEGDLLIQGDSWMDGISIKDGALMLDVVDDWYENPLIFDFDNMDSFLVCALMFLGEERIKLTDEQRGQIIKKLQAKTGDYTRKVNQAHDI